MREGKGLTNPQPAINVKIVEVRSPWDLTPGTWVASLTCPEGQPGQPLERGDHWTGCTDKGKSLSACVETRKMVNYARGGRSQGKPWWKSAAILTSKSFVRPGYSVERIIEPSGSWFPPNFPSGLRNSYYHSYTR